MRKGEGQQVEEILLFLSALFFISVFYLVCTGKTRRENYVKSKGKMICHSTSLPHDFTLYTCFVLFCSDILIARSPGIMPVYFDKWTNPLGKKSMV